MLSETWVLSRGIHVGVGCMYGQGFMCGHVCACAHTYGIYGIYTCSALAAIWLTNVPIHKDSDSHTVSCYISFKKWYRFFYMRYYLYADKLCVLRMIEFVWMKLHFFFSLQRNSPARCGPLLGSLWMTSLSLLSPWPKGSPRMGVEFLEQRTPLHPCTLTPKSHWTSAPRHLAKSLILKEVCPQDIEGKVAFGTDWVVDVVSVLSQDESFVR